MEINNISRPAQDVLIRIAVSWKHWVGPSGSYVLNSSLEKLLEATQPISVNKMTNSGRGRNGVSYSIIPMCKKYKLIEATNRANYTTYMLNDIGREVIRAILSICSYCGGTKLCGYCNDGVIIDAKCKHGYWNGDNYEYKSTEECNKCRDGLVLCSVCNSDEILPRYTVGADAVNEPGVCSECRGRGDEY